MKRLIKCFIGLLLLIAVSANAHLTYPSEVYLDMNDHQTKVEIRIPVDDLLLALPEKLAQQPITKLVSNNNELLAYLYAHFTAYVETPNKPLDVRIHSIELKNGEDAQRLIVHASITNATSLDTFIIQDNLVTHKVINHKSIALLRSDFENGILVEEPQPIGTFDYQHETLEITRAPGSPLNGTLAFVKMGVEHIDHGLDHLAFLVCLLILAPMSLQNKSWQISSNNNAIINVIKLVSLFTLGHTLTLILVSFNIVQPHTNFIEILICATIMITAFHAIKPIRYFHESLATLVFGLIHGAAFSTTLKEFHLDTINFALSLAGFNIGIELAQIIAIALLFPWLLILSLNIRLYGAIKNGLAGFLFACASYWLYQRITNQAPNLDDISGWDFYMQYILTAIIVLIPFGYALQYLAAKNVFSHFLYKRRIR